MYKNNLKRQKHNDIYLLDYKQGDITGNGILDSIFLIGNRPFGSKSPFFSNLQLLIQKGDTNYVKKLPLKENRGYMPSIFLGDFTGDKIDDILISIDTGGSGELAYYYIYSYNKGHFIKIFDHEDFNNKYKYEVIYMDNYKVKIITEIKDYLIDINYKGKEYLDEIYTNTTLKDPLTGWVNPLGGLYPIDFKKNKVYELYATQKIAGRYNADSLGYVQTSLSWNGIEFEPFFQTIGILG